MKPPFIVVLTWLACSGPLFGQSARLEKALYDLGRTRADLSLDVPVWNDGDKPLTLSLVGTTCGCFEVVAFDPMVAPGTRGRIQIKFHAAAATPGRSTQQVAFKSNDAKKPTFQIQLAYLHYPTDVAIYPPAVEIVGRSDQDGADRHVAEREIVIRDFWDHPLAVKDVQASSPYMAVTWSEVTHTDLARDRTHYFKMVVTLQRGWPVGDFDEFIEVATNHPNFAKIRIPVKGTIRSSVGVSPAVVLLRNLNPGDPIDRTIVLKTIDGSRLIIDEQMAVSFPGLSVSQERVAPDQVRLRLKGSAYALEDFARQRGRYANLIQIRVIEPQRFTQSINVSGTASAELTSRLSKSIVVPTSVAPPAPTPQTQP